MKFFYANFVLATVLNLSAIHVSASNTLRGSGRNEEPSTHHRFLQEDESGTFVVADIEYSDEGPFPTLPEQTVNIELANGLIYELVNVNPSWINGKRKSLESGKSKIKVGKGAIVAGDKIDLRGRAPEEVQSLFERNLEDSNHRKLASTHGTRRVLAVKVIASDGQYGFDEATLSDEVFGTFGDPVNLASQYKACSFNQLNFVPAEDPLITNGVVTITVDTSITQGDGAVRNAVTSAINALFGVSNPNQIADHVMYCLPPETMGGIAYAYINSWNSVYSNQWCNYVSGQMHEIGHNLGFAHSSELGTYKDQSGMMGYSYGSDDGPIMCFNAAKSFQSGWYPTKTITPASADCDNFDGRVYGLSDFGTVGGTTVVKINNSLSGQPDYFLNYNKKAGINSGTVEGGNQVMITSTGSEGTAYSESELLAKLSIGGTYTIADFEGTGNDVTITFESMDATTSPSPARVVISYNGMVCGSGTASPVTPVPSKAPVTSSPSKAPMTAAPITPSPSKAPVTSAPITAPPSKAPVTSAPITPSPTFAPTTKSPSKNPTPSPTRKPVTSSPTPEPCWAKGDQCDPNGAHKCCNGCQKKGRNAGTCK